MTSANLSKAFTIWLRFTAAPRFSINILKPFRRSTERHSLPSQGIAQLLQAQVCLHPALEMEVQCSAPHLHGLLRTLPRTNQFESRRAAAAIRPQTADLRRWARGAAAAMCAARNGERQPTRPRREQEKEEDKVEGALQDQAREAP